MNMKRIIFVALILFVSMCKKVSCTEEIECPVYIAISLTGMSVEESFLEVRWGPGCTVAPDWIGFFMGTESVSKRSPQLKILTDGKKMGKFLTNVRIGEIQFPGGWNKSEWNRKKPERYPSGKCLNYFVGSFLKGELISLNCFKILPNWMKTESYVSQTPFKDLFIPGTHSSGAYYNDLKDKSILLKYFGYTQNFDVWSQLVFGIRFLDLHIGYNENDTNGDYFWIVHENLFINPLRVILDDIRSFALASDEVIMIDFSHLSIGFSKRPDRCKLLRELIEKTMGDIALRVNETHLTAGHLTVTEFEKLKKNLLITFPLKTLPCEIYDPNGIVWPSWETFSVGMLNASSLRNYMRKNFFKLASDSGWIFHFASNLESSYDADRNLLTTKQRASELNAKVAEWLGGTWSLSANVVTIDFFTNTNLIDIAIYANRHRSFISVNTNYTIISI